jgi:hypothetical protein
MFERDPLARPQAQLRGGRSRPSGRRRCPRCSASASISGPRTRTGASFSGARSRRGFSDKTDPGGIIRVEEFRQAHGSCSGTLCAAPASPRNDAPGGDGSVARQAPISSDRNSDETRQVDQTHGVAFPQQPAGKLSAIVSRCSPHAVPGTPRRGGGGPFWSVTFRGPPRLQRWSRSKTQAFQCLQRVALTRVPRPPWGPSAEPRPLTR